MNILFLCNKSPFPAREGGPIAMNMMIEGMIHEGHRVKVLAVNSEKYTVDPKDIPAEYRTKTGIELVPVDLRVKRLPAFLNLFTSRSYHIERFISRAFREKLESVLKSQQFDIVQFEMVHMSPYLETVRKYSNAKAILRAHNIEHLIWQRISANTKNPLKRFYLHHLSKTLKKYELSVIHQFDGIVAITEKDADYFRNNAKSFQENKKHLRYGKIISPDKIISIPFGIDLSRFPAPSGEPEFPSLFTIGSMDWNPNIEGISWFLEKIWPSVHTKIPGLKFYIAGRNIPDWLKNAGIPNVVVVGEVENSLKFMHSKSIMIVPLLSGSGIRIKIIEGMAAGKAIVSTRIGAEGIQCTQGKDILLDDTPEAFSESVCSIAEDKDRCRLLGTNARKLVEEEYSQEKLIRRILGFYEFAGT